MLHNSQLAHPDDCGLIAPVATPTTDQLCSIHYTSSCSSSIHGVNKVVLCRDFKRAQQLEDAVMVFAASFMVCSRDGLQLMQEVHGDTCRALILPVFLASLPVMPAGKPRRPFSLKMPGDILR